MGRAKKYATAADKQRAYRERMKEAVEASKLPGEFAVEYCKPRDAWGRFMDGLTREAAVEIADRLKPLMPRGSDTRVIQIGGPLPF